MIRIQFEKEKQRSAAYDGAVLIGRCEAQMSGTTWTITHTEVDPSYGGQGIARKLVLCVAEQAEKEGAEVIPVCSYAKKVFTQTE